MKSREDRKKFFLSQFGILRSRLERVEGRVINYSSNSHVAPPALAGCWLSHLDAYHRFLSTNDSHALIFEDDAKITDKLLEILNDNFIDYYLKDVDLLQLGYLRDANNITVDSGKVDILYRYKVKIQNSFIYYYYKILEALMGRSSKDNNKFNDVYFERHLRSNLGLREPLIRNSFEAGTHCYIISRHLAKKMIKCNNDPVIMAPDLLFIELANSKFIKSYRVSKSLSFQNNRLETSIHERSSFAWKSRLPGM
jgi:GR25 family glycosyltransferase involved in LPS biosynthesis